MRSFRRTIAGTAVVLAGLLATPAAQASSEPNITDPAGDASTSCWLPVVFPCSTTSQPSADILAVGSTVRQSLVVDIDVFDVDHPGYGSGPEDRTRHTVAFSIEDAWVNMTIERDTAGNIIDAYLAAGHGAEDLDEDLDPIDVRVDTTKDRIALGASLAILGTAVQEACPGCAPVGRGTELRNPFAVGEFLDRDSMGMTVIGPASVGATDFTDTGTAYTI